MSPACSAYWVAHGGPSRPEDGAFVQDHQTGRVSRPESEPPEGGALDGEQRLGCGEREQEEEGDARGQRCEPDA